MESSEPVQLQLPALWVGGEQLPLTHVNQIFLTVDQDEIFVSLGAAAPPMLLGSSEEIQEQAAQLPYVPIQTVVRFALSPRRLHEFADVFSNVSAAVRRGEESSDEDSVQGE